MRVLVVLPTFNEADNVERVLRRTRAALPEAGILVVDDGSPDGTADLAEKIGCEIGQIDVMRRTSRQGLGKAYRAGFAWGMERGYEAMVEMDSDLSHDPGALPGLVSAADDHDLVIGSRYVPGGSIPQWRLHRRLISRGGNMYSVFMLGIDVKDMTAGFRVYRSALLSQMELDEIRADGYGFQVEMTYRAAQAGARIIEVPIRFVDREMGDSKMTYRIVAEALVLVTRLGLARAARRLTASRPSRLVQPSGRP